MSEKTATACIVMALCFAMGMCSLGEAKWKAAESNAKAEIIKACLAAGKNFRMSWGDPVCE